MKIKSKVLIIAGSDSSGGAGIQADIKTVTSLGSYAMTAITAITSQNTTGVLSISKVPENEIKKIHGTKILVINCLQIKEHISHLNLEEALELVNKLKVEKVYFTHISHNLGLYDKIESILPGKVNLAYDNLKVEL